MGGGDRELDVEAARAMLRHRWPRNIRELERSLETAIALAGTGPLLVTHLKLDAPPAPPPVDDTDSERRAELVALLEKHKGNVSAIADALGKKRQQIQKWLRKLGLDAERYR
jgi:transcriptional regulator of acetoin/glycerol metabolism